MIELRRTLITRAGHRVEYVAEYRIDASQLVWGGKACFDGDWQRIEGGTFTEVALGFEELAVVGSIEEQIEQRIAGQPW